MMYKKGLVFLKKQHYLKLLFWRLRSFFLKISFYIQYKGVYKGKNIQIIGFNKVNIGKGSTLGDFFWLNINNKGYQDNIKSVQIGEYSNFGRNNFITVGDKLTIGDYFFSSCYCSIIGASHRTSNPFVPYILSDVIDLGKGIYIGTNVFMGAHSMVAGSVNIGFGSIIGARALVNQDIPPLSVVVGNPAKVIKRYSIEKKQWVGTEEFTEAEIISEDEYLNMIKKNHPSIPAPYHAATERVGWV